MSSEPRRRKTFELRLTKLELIHLRDLFSITLATEAKQTVSQALAQLEERGLVESRLWVRLNEVFKLADLPRDDEAPDYVVSVLTASPVGVYRLAHDPDEATEEQPRTGDMSNPFEFQPDGEE